MFDENLINQGSQGKRRQAVAATVATHIVKGTFTYTEVLVSPEPLRSDALEALDGVHVANNIPHYQAETTEDWGGKPLVLVCVSKDDVISHQVKERQNVPGTNRYKWVKRLRTYGNFAAITDAMPERVARQILVLHGWPILQHASNGGRIGTVVEWRWLEKEVMSATPSDGAVELYEEIMTRKGFKEFLASHEPAEEKAVPNKTKNTGAQPQGARP